MVNLDTTNVLLGIMATASVLEVFVLLGIGISGIRVYRHWKRVVEDLETRQIAPIRERVDAILGDVQTITARVSQQTERVDQAISGTIYRVDETADRVKGSVREKVNQAVGVVRGIRAVIASMMNGDAGGERPASAAERV